MRSLYFEIRKSNNRETRPFSTAASRAIKRPCVLWHVAYATFSMNGTKHGSNRFTMVTIELELQKKSLHLVNYCGKLPLYRPTYVKGKDILCEIAPRSTTSALSEY